MRLPAIAAFTIALAGLPAVTLAQDQSGQVEQSTRKPPVPPPLEPEVPQINVKNKPELATGGSSVRVKVRKFVITGSRAYTAESLHSLVAEGEGHELTLAEIKAYADQITKYYRANNYGAAWAYVPAQSIQDGDVEIAVVEARVGKVLVGGNEVYSSAFLLRHIQGLEEDDVLSLSALEKQLYVINGYPGIRVKAQLRPGDGPGLTDIYLQAEDKGPILATMDFDNFGTKSVGYYRVGATIDYVNVMDWGHYASLRYVEGMGLGEMSYLRLSYTMPLPPGPVVSFSATKYDFEAGGDITLLEPLGAGEVATLLVTYPIYQTKALKLVPEIGFEYKDLSQDLLGATVSEDKLRVLVAGLQFEWNDGFAGRWTGAVQYRKGMPGTLGGMEDVDPDASRFGGGGEFERITAMLFRLQKITSWAFLVGRVNYQKSDDLLVVSEQYSVGGADSVRGYPAFEIMGDAGLGWSVELRLKLDPILGPSIDPQGRAEFWNGFQLVFFYESAKMERNDTFLGALAEDERAGAGFGFRYEVEGWGSLRFDVGFPQSDEDPSTGDSRIYYVSLVSTLK